MSNMDIPEQEARGRDPSFSGLPAPQSQSLSSRTASQLQFCPGLCIQRTSWLPVWGQMTVGETHVDKADRDGSSQHTLLSPREEDSSQGFSVRTSTLEMYIASLYKKYFRVLRILAYLAGPTGQTAKFGYGVLTR